MVRKSRKAKMVKIGKRSSRDQQQERGKEERTDALIVKYGRMVEEFYKTDIWREIIRPLLQGTMEGLCGRFSGERYIHGEFITGGKYSLEQLKGYQTGIAEFINRLDDFVKAKDKLKRRKDEEEMEKRAPLINPFLEEEYDEG